MKLYSRIEGSGFPVVILHGLLGSSENWRAVSKRLSRTHRIYGVDLRNHGQSPHSEIMTYPVMADDLREFFERKGISEAHLVGHSLGGKVAMQLATSYPDRVKKLVVVDIAPKAYPPSQRPILTALQRLELQSFQFVRRNRYGARVCHSRNRGSTVSDEKYCPGAEYRFSVEDRSCFHRKKL